MTGQAESPWAGPEGSPTWTRRPAGLRTLIVGAGRAGRALARELGDSKTGGLHPIGFLDDASSDATSFDTASSNAANFDPANLDDDPSPAKHPPLPLLGTLADLPRLTTDHAVEAVVLAIPGLPPSRTRELAHAATAAGAVVRYLPWYAAALSREATAADLRPLDVRALIDAPEPPVVSPEAKEIITGKRVLVTGAASALGSELCRQLHAFNPASLFLLGTDEQVLRSLRADVWGEVLTTDLLDRDETDQTFRELRPEVVFHAEALRQAAVLERRPSHGVKANVLSTDNLVRAAARHGTERFVQLAADADPASMLGASQRVAEAVVLAAAHKAAKPGKKHRTEAVFTAVRIGDVLDARGSLLTTLADQIRAGGPVTVTHPDATRCFATVEEAVALTLEASRIAAGGEIFTLDLGEPTQITEVISRFTQQYHLPEVPIRFVGQRHGRKNPRPAERIPTSQPQIFTTPAAADPADYAHLPEQLDKLYKAAAKNRDPKVRQMLVKLAKQGAGRPG
ncbi:polysaccharide biosynthesis protein CapD [Catenulispora acidiphila DSM 44928]|uniref:Polysaccharide biosynthesis protein CapD n=1 Tax=Catenulispora acidiphila (strain DSM 44928 / JCM 14897 / NBRC 102108 / NRRL B-24433 / ID139908) TaxID=479433 RepID=C7PX22_CATAD|nr:polysaccharide biosynthesis protein [Catenulispora acidiphila]ACU77279.1 polysaccharide biosynthesis protein CapD [Catenulispora acidiphila DSM 44928]